MFERFRKSQEDAREEAAELRAATLSFERSPARLSPEYKAYVKAANSADAIAPEMPPVNTDEDYPLYSCALHRWGEAKDGRPMRPKGSCPFCIAAFDASRAAPPEVERKGPVETFAGTGWKDATPAMDAKWEAKRAELIEAGVPLPGSGAERRALEHLDEERYAREEYLRSHPDEATVGRGPYRIRGQSPARRRFHLSASEKIARKRGRFS